MPWFRSGKIAREWTNNEKQTPKKQKDVGIEPPAAAGVSSTGQSYRPAAGNPLTETAANGPKKAS